MRFPLPSLFSIVLSPLGALLLIAATTPPAAKPANPAPASSAGKHFLWRVTDVPQPFYILGSYHALRAKDYPLGAAVDEAIGQCKRFVFEYDFEHVDQAAFNRKLNDAARYPSGITLKQKISPKTYAYIQKISQTRASSYDDVKPWAIAFFMYGHPNIHDIYGYYGVESYVRRKHPAAEVGGLETADEHIRVLSDMSDIEGEVFLLQAMAYGDRQMNQFGQAVNCYKHGDLHGLAHIDYQEEKEAPYLVQRIITKRNANWIPRIEAEMKTGKPTMIVVGARHLCGPYNVIDMLRAHGHKLEQL